MRRIMRKWDLIQRRESKPGSDKKRAILAFVKAFKNTCVVRSSSVSSSRDRPPKRPITARYFQPSDDPVIPELEEVLKFCNVKTNVKFSDGFFFWKMRSTIKIAEGSYGEIYQFKHVDGTKRIFKCIPIDGQHPMSSCPNIPLSKAVTDIVSSKCLSDLNEGPVYLAPNFPITYNICLVRDIFPELLMTAWWDYKNDPERLKDPVEHPQPDQFSESQLYLTIESSFCGEPLTMKLLQNAWVGVSIMSQIISALAVAEAAYGFEHRDLHLGNILVQNTSAVSLKYTTQNRHFCIETVGCHVFIIDFTLSRICCNQNVYCIPLDDLAGRNSGRADSAESLWQNHNNMYSIMAEYSKGRWDKCMPVTNVLWLKYTSEHVLGYLEKNNPCFRKLVPPQNEHKQMAAMRLLRKWNNCILNNNSATDLLQNVILKDNPLASVCE